MEKFSYLKSANAGYIDDLFSRYLDNPESIDDSWRYFFDGLDLGTALAETGGIAHAAQPSPATAASLDAQKELRVAELIMAYRYAGALIAEINPIYAAPSSTPSLNLETYGLSNADLSQTFTAARLIGLSPSKLSDIITALRQIYCGPVSAELAHIHDPVARNWIVARVEKERFQTIPDPETRKHIMRRLSQAEGFERFLHTRYVAQKRFSIEGGEGAIPALDCIIESGAELEAKEFVIGMAHRGRLNVLTHIMGKKPDLMFSEFEGKYKVDPSEGEGDVKYHKGYSADFTTRKGKQVHLSLAFNPSHLEFVNAVVEGAARAKQDLRKDADRKEVVPILIHGDAAFAGQGVCYEVLNLTALKGYATGGTVHVVINNQVGFTTDWSDSRSTAFCTDLAKMLDSPIFHVNGDDADAIWQVSQLAIEYRQKFKRDVFIDIVCYRKHGHNEGDEPSFTQPLMYKKIKTHGGPRDAYAARLDKEKVLTTAESNAVVEEITATLTAAQTKARAENPSPKISKFEGQWHGLKTPSEAEVFAPALTQVSAAALIAIAEKINTMPAGFTLHSKLARFFEGRLKAVREGKGIDWGCGEALAYASLVAEGTPIRLSGQDAERGTFTHRHSVVHDFETGQEHCTINSAATGHARYEVYNSHLSETGVMGFEYGYSIAAPKTLTIWEAQFGDFANGAQVIIDQFVATSETKWQRSSGLVLLLPHGYEGQGPEHSSARLERFLQLCGRNNIAVANLTTPAQIFHALRRQVRRDFRKPLVIMSPKSLLRHPMATSSIEEFTGNGFQEVLDDAVASGNPAGVRRVLLCSGKIYYDLLHERVERKLTDVAIVRVEQLYPWPAGRLAAVLSRYSAARDIVWVQEEPRNMGAWTFVFNTWAGGLDTFISQVGGRMIRYVGRATAASPAVGSPKVHEVEQKSLIAQAFANTAQISQASGE